VTNDFPTGHGSAAAFIRTLTGLLPPEQVVVYTASMPGDAAYDATVGFPVLRDPARNLLPTAKVAAGIVDAFQAYGCDRVLFGAAAPLGLLAPALRQAGARRLVGITHTREVWWARLPVARQALRRIGDSVDVLTYLGDATRSVVAPALSPAAAGEMARLAPGVDPDVFRPGHGGPDVRRRYGIGPRDPVVVCVAALARGMGQDRLVRTLPRVLDAVPDARLMLVGGGTQGRGLAELARSLGVADRVVLTGAVPRSAAPPYLDAGNVFVWPGRTRIAPPGPEPVGTVLLEAQSCRLPVVVAGSSGSAETILVGETGYLVARHDPVAVADRLIELLRDPHRAAGMGRSGRAWIERSWTWDQVGARLTALLAG